MCCCIFDRNSLNCSGRKWKHDSYVYLVLTGTMNCIFIFCLWALSYFPIYVTLSLAQGWKFFRFIVTCIRVIQWQRGETQTAAQSHGLYNMKPVAKSVILLGQVISAEQRTSKHWELTEEGAEIAAQGSHEARVYSAIPEDGLPQSELMVRSRALGVSLPNQLSDQYSCCLCHLGSWAKIRLRGVSGSSEKRKNNELWSIILLNLPSVQSCPIIQ